MHNPRILTYCAMLTGVATFTLFGCDTPTGGERAKLNGSAGTGGSASAGGASGSGGTVGSGGSVGTGGASGTGGSTIASFE